MSSSALRSRLLRPVSSQLCFIARPFVKIQSGTSNSLLRNASSSTFGGDMGNPQSSSSDQSQVKSSRATDGTSSPDTASVQQPVSNRSKIPGDQDEGTDSHDKVKRDPSEPAEEKRKSVESQGNKPLGAEDHQ